jgi:hypothetical protein
MIEAMAFTTFIRACSLFKIRREITGKNAIKIVMKHAQT